jgi:hypothetical protein
MIGYSSIEAATEGFRVMRREPKAVAYWIAVWAVALVAVATSKALLGGPVARGASHDAAGVIKSYGPLATIFVPTLLALWVMNTATVYRAVLTPGEHGWHLFKLGADEARIAAVSALGAALLAVFGGVPAYLLLVLFNPLFLVAPGLKWVIAVAGAVTTVILEVWIAVRLSLAPVQTFAVRGFPFADYWEMTRGAAWKLLGAYALVVLEIAIFFTAFVLIGLVAEPLFANILAWQGPRAARLVLILGLLVPIAAVSSSAAFVIPSVLVCGCQAYAYRIITRRPAAGGG